MGEFGSSLTSKPGVVARASRKLLFAISGNSSGLTKELFLPELIRVPSTSGSAGYSTGFTSKPRTTIRSTSLTCSGSERRRNLGDGVIRHVRDGSSPCAFTRGGWRERFRAGADSGFGALRVAVAESIDSWASAGSQANSERQWRPERKRRNENKGEDMGRQKTRELQGRQDNFLTKLSLSEFPASE